MPTTKFKNLVYHWALPLKAPRLERHPVLVANGHPFHSYSAYARLLRKYHVMGSAALISSGVEQTLLLSSSENPAHTATRETLFRVASITKMAVALCTLVLCGNGSMDLSAPFSSFFPGEKLPPELDGITMKHLLSHTSGLSDPPELEKMILSGVPFPEAVRGCSVSSPGSSFRYSNLGYGLIGCALEALTGEPVSRVLASHVFQPLGMRATLDASTLNPAQIMPVTRIMPYQEGMDLKITPLGAIPLTTADPLRHYGHTAGSMYTDVDSLYRLILCLRQDGRPLVPSSLGGAMRLEAASYGRISPTLSYGLGLLIIRDPSLSDSRILGHQGFAYGCADGAFWEERTGDTVIFLNGGCSEERVGRMGRCNRDVLRLMLRKEFPGWHRSSK